MVKPEPSVRAVEVGSPPVVASESHKMHAKSLEADLHDGTYTYIIILN